MEFYTLEDAHYLIEYYKDKVIGKQIEPAFKSYIERLDVKKYPIKDDFDNDMYSVVVYATKLQGIIPRRSIDLVAFNLALASPESVLKNREQIE